MKKVFLISLTAISFLGSHAQQRVQYVATLASSELFNNNSLTMPVIIPATSNCLTVTVSEFKTSFPLTVTDLTTSRSLVAGVSVKSKGGSLTAIYYLINPGTGTHNINVSSGSLNNKCNIKAIVSCYSGVDTEFPVSNISSNNNAEVNNNVTLDVSSANRQMVIDAIAYEKQVIADTKSITQTRISYINTNGWNFASSYKEGYASSVNMAWDYSADGGAIWSIASLSLQPSTYNIVPVSLIDFTAKRVNNTVEFSWATNFESRTAYVTLERSTDSRNWSAITEIKAAGTSDTRKYYNTKDANPVNGTLYYRLRVTNTDGSRGFSNYLIVIYTTAAKTMELVQMPNPFVGSLQVKILMPSTQDLKLRVVSFQGRTLIEKTVQSASGFVTLNVDETSKLEPGMYALECRSGETVISKVLIKQ